MIFKYKGKEMEVPDDFILLCGEHADQRGMTLEEYIAEAFSRFEEAEKEGSGADDIEAAMLAAAESANQDQKDDSSGKAASVRVAEASTKTSVGSAGNTTDPSTSTPQNAARPKTSPRARGGRRKPSQKSAPKPQATPKSTTKLPSKNDESNSDDQANTTEVEEKANPDGS